MATRAAENALSHEDLLTVADIDLVVVATTTAVDRSPNMAARVAWKLGLGAPVVLEINVACAGFNHALAIADHTIRAGAATSAVVIGSERMTDATDWTDRTTRILVGDGAGAVVLTASDKPELGPVVSGAGTGTEQRRPLRRISHALRPGGAVCVPAVAGSGCGGR